MQNVSTTFSRLCSFGLRWSFASQSTVSGLERFVFQSSQSVWRSRHICCSSLARSFERPASAVSQPCILAKHVVYQQHLGDFRRQWPMVHTLQKAKVRLFRTVTRDYAGMSSNFGSLTEREYTGHPDKFEELPLHHLKRIFGPTISKTTGNNLLRTIQKQRITGTLDEDIKEPQATPELIAQGLAWLRANYVLDEDAAIIKRIEEEDKQMEQEFISGVEKYKKYHPQQSVAEDGLYGKSRFEELRKQNQAKAAMRENQEADVRRAHGTTTLSGAQNRAVLTHRTDSAEWVKRYKERAALSKMLEPPQMSLTRRLLPSTIFAAVALVLCFLFATNYKPPIREARVFPDTPPAATTVLTLIGLNATIFVMWRIPFLWRFMNKNFLLIAATPYPPSLLGNIFSHQGIGHLAINMAFLWLVGTRLHDQIGRGNFLAVYLAGGVFASWASLLRLVLQKHLVVCTLGCSGAVSAILATWLCLVPASRNRMKVDLLGQKWDVDWRSFVPKVLLGVLVMAECVGLFRGIRTVDHFSHLGGYLIGMSFSVALLQKVQRREMLQSPETFTVEEKSSEWRAPAPIEKGDFGRNT